MTTATGATIFYDDPHTLDVRLEDVRIATTNICRYNGHINWRLVQHLALCVLLAREAGYDRLQAAYCAAHDVHEIYAQDVVSGLKRYLPMYRAIEAAFEIHVHDQLGLPLCHKDEDLVKTQDLRALVVEMTYHNHPAASRAASYAGGAATTRELEIISTVANMSMMACWELVVEALEGGVQALMEQEIVESRN